MKFLTNDDGFVVALRAKFIYQEVNNEVPSSPELAFDSWESVESGLEDIYGDSIPESVAESLKGLKSSVDFENTSEDTDIRSESFSSMTYLGNALRGTVEEEDYPKVEKFIEDLRAFYEPIVRDRVLEGVSDKMGALIESILEESEGALDSQESGIKLDFFRKSGKVPPSSISNTFNWLKQSFDQDGFKSLEGDHSNFKESLGNFWKQLEEHGSDVYEDPDLNFLREHLGITEESEDILIPENSETQSAKIEKLPIVSASRPVLSVATTVGNLTDVLASTRTEIKNQGLGDLDNFAPNLFA